jgi:hypothetical protein
VITPDGETEMGEERRRKTNDEIHWRGADVPKLHIDVPKCAFTL